MLVGIRISGFVDAFGLKSAHLWQGAIIRRNDAIAHRLALCVDGVSRFRFWKRWRLPPPRGGAGARPLRASAPKSEPDSLRVRVVDSDSDADADSDRRGRLSREEGEVEEEEEWRLGRV